MAKNGQPVQQITNDEDATMDVISDMKGEMISDIYKSLEAIS